MRLCDIVLDTNVLGDFLAQYFDDATGDRGHGTFEERDTLTSQLVRRLNSLVQDYRHHGEPSALVIASSLAFVELARKWDEIVRGRYRDVQLRGLIEQPPDWFQVASLDSVLVRSFVRVPTSVFLRGRLEPIEWTDAVHVATMLSRGDEALLATTDCRLAGLDMVRGRLAV